MHPPLNKFDNMLRIVYRCAPFLVSNLIHPFPEEKISEYQIRKGAYFDLDLALQLRAPDGQKPCRMAKIIHLFSLIPETH